MTARNLRLLETSLPLKPPRRMDPLHREITEYQGLGMDVVGCHGSAVKHWREFNDLDGQSDDIISDVAAELRRRGLPYLADRLDLALVLDHKERDPLARLWSLFGQAAEAGRQLVGRIEKLFGRKS